MQVAFWKHEEKGRRAVRWAVERPGRTQNPSAHMGVGNDIPHDLAQYVIEAAAHYENGFWGLQARGATFKRTGRRLTKPGRALIAEHRAEVIDSEKLAGLHWGMWRAGQTSPVTEALERAFTQWQELRPDERIVFEWPSAQGRVESGSEQSQHDHGRR